MNKIAIQNNAKMLGVQDNLPRGDCYWREFIENSGYDMRSQYYNSQDYE